ncbi:hypothetical protein N7893_000736 [Vibrio vulnificus]|nr:hypothetical protein [Vibrio vulnificus]HAS8554143.1 hypothetical protein [Vibrio vulnificus]
MKFNNKKKSSFLESIPSCSIESSGDTLAQKCKFNFSYFDSSQTAGTNIEEIQLGNLQKLFVKLQEYGKFNLTHWTREPIGHGKNHVLEIYGSFPRKSDFVHPKHVPHQAQWARFRLDRETRLVGFTLDKEYDGMQQNKSGFCFCSNTFYVVFIDEKHGFYKTQ